MDKLSLPHSLVLDERERLSVSGVEDVESFDEGAVVARTTLGTLIIRGEGLHIERLSLDSGELVLEGFVNGLEYEAARRQGGFLRRLFG